MSVAGKRRVSARLARNRSIYEVRIKTYEPQLIASDPVTRAGLARAIGGGFLSKQAYTRVHVLQSLSNSC